MWKTSALMVAAAVAVTLASGSPVRAQSCGELQAQLNSLSGGGGGNLAAARQRLATLQRQASANGCKGSSSMGKPRACAGIESTIRTVSGQIATLEARGGAGDQNRRKRIQAQMAKQKCGEAPARQQQARPAAPAPAQAAAERGSGRPDYVVQNNRIVPTKRTEGSGLFSLLFGGGRSAGAAAEGGGDAPPTLARLQPGNTAAPSSGERPSLDREGKVTYARHFFGGGSYRTLCVRSCDGYYFPISTVTTRGNFARDDAVCQSLCPQAALYAHTSGSESESMYRVVDGRSYRELETAFAYRKVFNPACTCNFAAKMIISADGRELIDVEGSRAAYSPAATTDAAVAIEGIAAAGNVGVVGHLAIVAEDGSPAVEPAVIEGVDPAVVPASIDASAVGTAAASVTTDGAATVPLGAAQAVPLPGVVDAAPMAAAPADFASEDGEAVVVPASSTATAPRSAPVPAGTQEPLRVRTIGPEFLQSP